MISLSKILPEATLNRVNAAADQLGHEVQNNERLKWILLIGAVVLYGSVILFLSGLSDKARANYGRLETQLGRMTMQSSESGWSQRADDAEALLADWNSRFWPGDTTGIAEASFERWIRQRFEEFGTEVRQVQLTRGPAFEDAFEVNETASPSVLRIRAKVIGSLREHALINFLESAANSEDWVVVEQLIVRGGRNPRFEMDLATFARPNEDSP